MAFAQARVVDCPSPEGDPYPPLTTAFRINGQEAGSEFDPLGGGFREGREGVAFHAAAVVGLRFIHHRPESITQSRIGSINTVYFEIEIGNVTLRADAKERLASTTAGDVELATEIREPMWSAGSFEGFVRETWSLLGPAGVSDTAPGVSPASRPCGLRGPPSAWFL